MSEPVSVATLGEWLRKFRLLDQDPATTEGAVNEHLDSLSDSITSMTIDFELMGLNTHDLKTLAIRQNLGKHRRISQRFEVVDQLMILAARLQRAFAESNQGDDGPRVAVQSPGDLILPPQQKGESHNDKMLAAVDPQQGGDARRVGWKALQWAEFLACDERTVRRQPAWGSFRQVSAKPRKRTFD